MESEKNDYHISIFKPTTDSARRNRNLVLQFVLIWAVAIFGFQILLKILEKPTPEPAYTVYETNWDDIQAGNMEVTNLQNVSQSALSVLGKIAIDPGHRQALDNAVSWMAYNIADSIQKQRLIVVVKEFEDIASVTVNVTDDAYVGKKNQLIPVLREIFNLHPNDVRGKIAPLEVKSLLMESFDADNRKIFEQAMGFYLIHNRSVLTDTKFLGFPFHYFYTAVFLLILFVGLCWLYCVRTDMFNKKYGIED
jgi:putative solute:sodium symporter small subunit